MVTSIAYDVELFHGELPNLTQKRLVIGTRPSWPFPQQISAWLSSWRFDARMHVRQATISKLEAGGPGTQLRVLMDALATLDVELVIRPRSAACPMKSRFVLMARRPASLPLNVSLNGKPVGHFRRQRSGAVDFQYDSTWLGWDKAVPVSLSLPLQEDRFVGDPLSPFRKTPA